MKIKKKTSIEIPLTPTERLESQLNEIVADFTNAEDLGDIDIRKRDWEKFEDLTNSTSEITISTEDRRNNIFVSRFGPSISITELTEWRIMLAARAYQQIINDSEFAKHEKVNRLYSPSKFISALYNAAFTGSISKDDTSDKEDSEKQQEILLRTKLSLNRVFIISNSEDHEVKEIHIPDFTWSPIYVFRAIFLCVIEPSLVAKEEAMSVLDLIANIGGINLHASDREEITQLADKDPELLHKILMDMGFPFRVFHQKAKQIMDCFDHEKRAFIRKGKTADDVWKIICNIFDGSSDAKKVELRHRGMVLRPGVRGLMKSLSLIAMHDEDKMQEYQDRLEKMIQLRKNMGQIKSSYRSFEQAREFARSLK